MPQIRHIIYGLAAAALLIGQAAFAQDAPKKKYNAPTVADWTALGKLPDFTGAWEIPLGGGRAAAGRGAPGAPAGAAGRGAQGRGFGRAMTPPQLTPEYAAKAKEEASAAAGKARAEDNETANCLPPGLPTIMGQPYPIEVLMPPGLVTIVIEAYEQVRHIYTDGRPLPEDPDPSFNGEGRNVAPRPAPGWRSAADERRDQRQRLSQSPAEVCDLPSRSAPVTGKLLTKKFHTNARAKPVVTSREGYRERPGTLKRTTTD